MKMTEAQVVKIDELSRKGFAIACEAFALMRETLKRERAIKAELLEALRGCLTALENVNKVGGDARRDTYIIQAMEARAALVRATPTA